MSILDINSIQPGGGEGVNLPVRTLDVYILFFFTCN